MKGTLLNVYCSFMGSRQLIFKKAGYELPSVTRVNSTKGEFLHLTVGSTVAYPKSRI